jgi:hypothetical protein
MPSKSLLVSIHTCILSFLIRNPQNIFCSTSYIARGKNYKEAQVN